MEDKEEMVRSLWTQELPTQLDLLFQNCSSSINDKPQGQA